MYRHICIYILSLCVRACVMCVCMCVRACVRVHVCVRVCKPIEEFQLDRLMKKDGNNLLIFSMDSSMVVSFSVLDVNALFC